MARELEVTVIVNDGDAKAKLEAIDAATEKAASTTKGLSTSVESLESSTKSATTAVNTGAQSWGTYTVSAKEANETLQALGNPAGGTLSKMRGTLNEVASAAGLTVDKLGLLNAAGLVVGAGIVGWNIGRAIADFFDLDKKIGNATASLLGWGDASKEAAGAVQDSINLAISRGATELVNITDKTKQYSEAIKFNAEFIKNQNEAFKFLGNSTAAWRAELDRNAGSLKAIEADLKTHVLSIAQIAEKYKVSQHAVELYRNELKATEDQEKRTAAIRKQVEAETDRAWQVQIKWVGDMNKATADLVDSQEKRRLEVSKAITLEFEKQVAALAKQANAQVIAEQNARTSNRTSQGFDANGNRLDDAIGQAAATLARTMKELEIQHAKGIATAEREQQALKAYTDAVSKATPQMDNFSGKVAGAGDAALGFAGAAAAAASSLGKIIEGINYQVPTGESLDRAGIIASTITQGGPGARGTIPRGGARPTIPWGGSRDGGGDVQAGSAYYVGRGAQPELFVPESDGHMTPSGAGAVTIGDIIIHGNVESAATADRLAQRTAELVYRKFAGQGKRPLARA